MALLRILEEEVMDSEVEALDYDSMDHQAVNEVFAADFLSAWHPVAGSLDLGKHPNGVSKEKTVLDLGTGTAQIPLEICRQDADIQILATDLAVSMLELARYNIEARGLIQRIHLAHVDAKGLPYSDGKFAAVISNSIVHHIPAPISSLQEAVRVTAEGGLLFFRDLLRPATLPELEQLVETYAGNSTPPQKRMFYNSLHAALTLEEVRELVQQLGFDPESVAATSDRHWTWCAKKSLAA